MTHATSGRTIARSVTFLLLAGALAAPMTDAKEPLILDGTTWGFPELRTKTKARAQRVGKTRFKGTETATLMLLPGDAWSGTLSPGLALAGTYTRKSETARRLALTLDAPSLAALTARYEGEVESAAALEGIDLDSNLALDRAKLVVVIRLRRKTGFATAKLKGVFKLSGTATVAGSGSTPSKVAGKIKGTSFPVLLAP